MWMRCRKQSAGGSQTICENGTATVSGASSANGTILWTEDGAGSITAGATTLTPTYTAAAGDAGNAVTLTMTVTSNNTCGAATATATYTVNVDALPEAAAGGSQTICENGTATVSGASSANGTILWTENGAGSITAGATTLTPTYTAAAGDVGNAVTLTMTVTSNNSCTPQTATATYTVNVDALPEASAGGSQTICETGTATVSGASSANGTILWTENGAGSITAGATTLTPTYTSAAGDAGNVVTLTMTVTSNNACGTATATATYTVTVNAVPESGTLNKTPDVTVVCEGTNVSATLTAGSGGAGTITDVLEYRFNGSGTWSAYTSGASLSTTGKTKVEIQTYRTASGSGCTTSTAVVATWNVNQAPTVTNNNRQNQTVTYGAAIATVTVTATDADSQGSDLVIDAVSYTFNGGSPISGLPDALSITAVDPPGANSRAWTVTGCMKGTGPGTYVIKVAIKDDCGVGNSKFTTFTIVVTPGLVLPVAEYYYTGATFYWTTGPSSSTASLTLAASIKNKFAGCGDITTARVSFFVRNGTTLTPINGAQNLPVGLVDPTNTNVGTASAIVQYNMGSATMLPLDICIKVTGNYTGVSDPTTEKQITLAVPLPGGQIVGGGMLDNLTSSGYISRPSDEETFYSLEVKFSKSLANPQGRVELTIYSKTNPAGVVDGIVHTYKVKSTAISTLVTGKPTPADAQFSSKANITEILANGTAVGVESGVPFVINLFDGDIVPGGPKDDSLGITIYRKNGGVWYSNNWVVNKTVMKQIVDGEVCVKSGVATKMPTTESTANDMVASDKLEVPT